MVTGGDGDVINSDSESESGSEADPESNVQSGRLVNGGAAAGVVGQNLTDSSTGNNKVISQSGNADTVNASTGSNQSDDTGTHSADNSQSDKLPQTNESRDGSFAAALGTILAGFLGLVGFKKRKQDDQ